MNYSHMIEEKSLKKTFIIATLISTIIGTFTTGMNLYEQMNERREQKRTDEGQNAKIKKLQKEIEDVKKQRDEPDDRWKWAVHRRRGDIRDEDVRDSLARGGMSVRREYDRDYRRFGDWFAEGDAITQNQLQGQIITLQSTVIRLLEDALYTGRIADINKLYNASELTRDGSIAALQQQYQRMLEAAPMRRGFGAPLLRQTSSTPTMKSFQALAKSRTRAIANGNHDETKFKESKAFSGTTASEIREVQYDADAADSTFSTEGPLFCRYAASLQHSVRTPLDPAFRPGGSNRCPECSAHITVEQGRSWKVVKEVVHEVVSTPKYDEEQVEERTYLLSNRFVVKCHREWVGFACVLCAQFRDRDTIMESARGLVRHVWQKHDVDEYGAEPDIREVGLEFHSEKAKYAPEPDGRRSGRTSLVAR